MEDVLMTILKIIGAVGLAVMVWLVVEGIFTVRKLRKTIGNLEERIEPTLANVENITESLQPAIEKVDPLMDRVQLTVDTVNLELMQVDKILGDASQMTGTASSAVKKVSDAVEAPTRAVNGAASKLRSMFGKKKNEARIERAIEEAAEHGLPEQVAQPGKTAFDIARDWAAEASGEYAESLGVGPEAGDAAAPARSAAAGQAAMEQEDRESFTSGIADDGTKGKYPSASALKDLLEEPAMADAEAAPDAVQGTEPAADVTAAEQKIADALSQLQQENAKGEAASASEKPTVAKSANELIEEALRAEE